MASIVSTTQLMEEAREAVGRLSGAQQLALVAEVLAELNGVVGGKSAKLAGAAGGGAGSVGSSKKPPTDAQQRWRDGIKEVQRLVREHADEEFAYGSAMKVASKVKLHEDFPLPPWEGVVEEAYAEWLAESAEGGSTATKSTTKTAPKKKLADMTPEEQKAFYKARAAKAAATKAAKKAAAAAEAEAEESEEEAPAPPPKVRKPLAAAAAAGGGGGAGAAAARPKAITVPLPTDSDEEEWE
jgi:hypothetical protein